MLEPSHQYKIRQKVAEEKGDIIYSNTMFPIKVSDINISLKDAVVKEVTYETAEKIISVYEWLGTMPTFTTHYFGIFFDGVCGGVVLYGISLPQSVLDSICGAKYGDKVRVLSRGACVHWSPKGSASKLIGASLRELEKQGYKIVVAYCDTRAGEIGTIYQACNFIYTGTSENGKEYFIDGKWRTGVGAGEYAHQKRDLSEYETRERSTKHRYIKLLGSKFEKKELLKSLNYPVLLYPKRESLT